MSGLIDLAPVVRHKSDEDLMERLMEPARLGTWRLLCAHPLLPGYPGFPGVSVVSLDAARELARLGRPELDRWLRDEEAAVRAEARSRGLIS